MNKEQFHEWKSSPTTIEVFDEIFKLKIALMEALGDGSTVSDSVDSTAITTARIVGTIQGINQLLEYNYEEEKE